MLDTNICSYIIKKKPENVFNKFKSIPVNSLCVSVITYAELYYGIEKTKSKKVNEDVLDAFLAMLKVYDWDKSAARTYAKIRNDLSIKGELIGNLDLMIAAHALSLNATVVTNNVSEFKRIKKLKIENWIEQ
jgi:tRNA(fMet)-specific endonuclease VapC